MGGMDEGKDSSSIMSEVRRLLIPRLTLNNEQCRKLKYYDMVLWLLRKYSSSTTTHIDYLVFTSLVNVICFQVPPSYRIPKPHSICDSQEHSYDLLHKALTI